jgi:diaminopimelate decarboxylase
MSVRLASRKADGLPLADRLVSENFGAIGSCLAIGGFHVDALTAAHGSPLYVYDGDVIVRRFKDLERAVAGFASVYYSIKANPNPAVAAVLVEAGAGLEIASGAELLLALKAGAKPERILFAGPGKGHQELELALSRGIGEIHLESFQEIETVAEIGERLSRAVNVAIRINPGTAAQGGAMRMGGKPTAFGFDEDMIDEVLEKILSRPNLHLSGIHLFAGTQILDADVLLSQWSYGLGLAAAVGRKCGRPLQRVDLGGGLGIPYHEGDASLDLGRVAAGSARLDRERRADPLLAGAEILIEPGRYLTGPAGVYLMSVRATKTSRGHRFVIADGGMHQHLAASGNLGQVIKRDYPIVAATRLNATERHPATLVGPLCTPLDTLGRQTPLPDVGCGDIIAVLQSGAYGLTASPVGFLSHPMAAEVLVLGGQHRLVRPRGSLMRPMSWYD